jgi:hypothetical protein
MNKKTSCTKTQASTLAAKSNINASAAGASGKKPVQPRSHRRLARAIFKECDMVAVGRELLKSKSETVKARVWETLVHYALGEFAPSLTSSQSHVK